MAQFVRDIEAGDDGAERDLRTATCVPASRSRHDDSLERVTPAAPQRVDPCHIVKARFRATQPADASGDLLEQP